MVWYKFIKQLLLMRKIYLRRQEENRNSCQIINYKSTTEFMAKPKYSNMVRILEMHQSS